MPRITLPGLVAMLVSTYCCSVAEETLFVCDCKCEYIATPNIGRCVISKSS